MAIWLALLGVLGVCVWGWRVAVAKVAELRTDVGRLADRVVALDREHRTTASRLHALDQDLRGS